MDDANNDDSGARGGNKDGGAGPVLGPSYVFWETSLERLKILNYEESYCGQKEKFSRVHFVFPAGNMNNQFEEFMDICSWLCNEITQDPGVFGRDGYDDPNTVANKLMLALRQLDCRLNFPAQKLRVPYGEVACSVLDFLTEKALLSKKMKWKQPIYPAMDTVEQAQVDDDGDDAGDVADEADDDVVDDVLFQEMQAEIAEVSLDGSAHQILHAQVDPIEWKTELERVGPKLRAQQQLTSNEWRAHVDSTVHNKGQIEKVLSDTQGDLQAINREITDELAKMKSKERYTNNQFSSTADDYKLVKQQLEDLEKVTGGNNEKIMKLTNEMGEITERLDELKETVDSKDSGISDTSPLVRIKAALQQMKNEIHAFDLRTGVVSHTLLTARVSTTDRRRIGAAQHARRRHKKNRRGVPNSSDGSGDEI